MLHPHCPPHSDTTDTTTAQSQRRVSLSPLPTPTLSISAGQRTYESGQHGGVAPNFLTYSPRTLTASSLPFAFAQVTALRPRAVTPDSYTQV